MHSSNQLQPEILPLRIIKSSSVRCHDFLVVVPKPWIDLLEETTSGKEEFFVDDIHWKHKMVALS